MFLEPRLLSRSLQRVIPTCFNVFEAPFATQMLPDYLKEEGTCKWVAKRRVLLDVWIGWMHHYSTWLAHMARAFKCRFHEVSYCCLESIMRYCGAILTSKLSQLTGAPDSLWLLILESKVFCSCVQTCSYMFSTWKRRSAHRQSLFKLITSQIPAIFISAGYGHLQHTEAR